jgi:hypothetical protein
MSEPPEKRMQQIADEFMSMRGNCITQWAHVEEELLEICLASLGCTRERAAIVYYKTPSIEARLTLVDELVTTVLPKRVRRSGGHYHPDLKSWKIVRDSVRDNLPTRNRLAHHPVGPRSATHGGFGAMEAVARGLPSPALSTSTWFEVHVSQSERLRERSAELSPLRIVDLWNHLVSTNRANGALHRFQYEILRKHIGASVPPESPQYPSTSPTTGPSTALQRRRKSSRP